MSDDLGIVTHKIEQQSKVTVVSEEEQRKWAEEKEEENSQLIAALEAKGHVCIIVLESYPSQVQWCKQEPCAEK